MTNKLTRRRVIAGGSLLGAAAVTTLAAGTSFADAPSTTPVARPRRRPVQPVNQAIADQMSIDYKVLPQQVVGVDVEKEIAIHTVADIEFKRTKLIDYIWKGAGLPGTLPDVQTGVSLPPELATLTGVSHTTRLTVPLRYGVKATLYLLQPQVHANHRLGIYHTGHGEDPINRLRAMQTLLDRGYAVLASDLPFTGWNIQRIQDPNDASKYVDIGQGTTAHNVLDRYETSSFSALTFYLEPLILAINYAEKVLRPNSIAMIGLSGGGWAATVTAAIDPRVTRSYPTAGSWPFYLRSAPPSAVSSTGDWEQGRGGATLPGFYANATFLDMYAMAAVGPHRGQIQILNRFDACCFNGVGARSYAPVVAHRVALIGDGSWDILEDGTHNQHAVSPYALEVILWDLETNPPDNGPAQHSAE